jgi:hypothetical protein
MVTTVLLLACTDARADVFKCTAEDGSLTFQQTPCPEQKVEKVQTDGPATEPQDCGQAQQFAGLAARLMRSGLRSDEVFDRYGGLDSLSKSSIGVVSYVYTFRTNDDVSIDRIASLTQAKCQARSLGDVSCETLPIAFAETLASCNPDLEEDRVASSLVAGETTVSPSGPIRTTANTARSSEAVAQCKKKNRDAIDAIDAEMRRGYSSEQGEAYRQRLRVLTEQLRSC